MTNRQIVLLVYPKVSLAQLLGMQELFGFANELYRFQHPTAEPLYHCRFYQLGGGTSYTAGALNIACDAALPDDIDTLLIPGSLQHEAAELTAMAAQFRQQKAWFGALQQQGTRLAAGCNGTFALAATGLLDQAQATTCWFLEQHFRHMFPKVQVCAEHLVCSSGNGLYTAGATTGYVQLVLQLIREQQGSRFVSQLSKLMLNEPASISQAPYMSVQQLVPHQDAKIADIQLHLQRHLAEELDLASLATKFYMSTRTLIRRFKQATGDTPMAFLQKLRIEKAKKMLETSLLPVEGIMQSVGYQDLSSFRKLFLQYTSLTPKSYRERFYLQDVEVA